MEINFGCKFKLLNLDFRVYLIKINKGNKNKLFNDKVPNIAIAYWGMLLIEYAAF